MKKLFVAAAPLLLAGLALFLTGMVFKSTLPKQQRPDLSGAMGCAPQFDASILPGEDGKFITLMPGVGDYIYAISTKVDSAQVYFNQGISMYFSYHSREAVASFKEAINFDNTAAMAYWGQALAMGPSYNFGHLYKLRPEIQSVLENMNAYAHAASEKEKALIQAMNQRYDVTDLADKQRSVYNNRYAAAMKQLVSRYPDDIDIKALYIDAVMLLHPWEFWFNDGSPKPWTPELVGYCKDVLAKNPQHPGGLHYYIHVTEASRQPEVALSSADSLIKLFPGIAHMVHMSSHEYERLGYYAKGVDANEKADRALVIYDSLAKGLFPQVHVSHYYAVDAYCAISGAMYAKSITKSGTLQKSVEPSYDKTSLQALYMFPAIAMVRMGRWDDILKDKNAINPQWTYALLLDDFARGMANLKKGNLGQAQQYLEQLRERKKDSMLSTKFSPYMSSALDGATVAENILAASILFSQEKYDASIAALKKAILAEDSILYSEPKLWMLPARQYLGSFYMQLKQYANAEMVYRDDLVWNPGNGWSTLGLHHALKAQQQTKELDKLKASYKRAFSEAEELPPGSAY